jgi:HPt (histidine-containing phosphotransfer) domain-containing protein
MPHHAAPAFEDSRLNREIVHDLPAEAGDPVLALTAHAPRGGGCFRAAGRAGSLPKCLDAAALERVWQRFPAAPAEGGPAGEGADGSEAEDEFFDRVGALARLGGSEKLLRRAAQLFLAESPRMLGAMREAIARGDRVALARLAHNLRGSVAVFGAPRVVAAAATLEKMRRDAPPGEAEAGLAAVERGLERLFPILRALEEGSVP